VETESTPASPKPSVSKQRSLVARGSSRLARMLLVTVTPAGQTYSPPLGLRRSQLQWPELL